MKYHFLLVLFILSLSTHSQDSFNTIAKDSSLNLKQKTQKFERLLHKYKSEHNFEELVKESYEIVKWHYSNDSLDQAIALNKSNLNIMDSLNVEDLKFYKRNIYSLGFYENENGEIQQALNTLKKLLEYEEPDEYSTKGALKVARIYYDSYSDYYKALEYYVLCKLLAEQIKDDDYLIKATLGIGRAGLVINTKSSLNLAINVTTKTLSYLESNTEIKNHKNFNNYYFSLNKLLGNLYSDRDDYDFDKSVMYLSKALEIATVIGDEIDLRNINNDLGLIYLKDERVEAESYFKTALGYWTDNVTYGVLHRNLAIHYINQDELDLSLQSVHKSIEALHRNYLSSLDSLPNKERLKTNLFNNQLISSLNVKTKVWLKLAEGNAENNTYYYEQALKTIKLNDWLIDLTRLSDIDYKSKLYWRKIATNLYSQAVELCYKTNKAEDAFYFFEKNKALQLLEDINLKTLRASVKIPQKIVRQEAELKDNIISQEAIKIAAPSEEAARELLIAKNKYDSFINSLDSNIKLLFKAEKPAEVINLKEVQTAHLDTNKVYLEYVLNNDHGYGLLVSKNNLELFEIPNFKDLNEWSQSYREFINQPLTNKEELEQFKSIAHKLYQTLIPKDIRPFLVDKVITIIPDNYLQNIPFEALLTSSEDDQSFLIKQNEINYAYSISFLIQNSNSKKDIGEGAVAFAPIEFKNELPKLSYSESEVNYLGELTSAKIYSKRKASKAKFLNVSKNAKILHIASHASTNDSLGPWISFYDQKLHLNELYNHNTNADLIVLSACNTSLGEVFKGEGVMSLSRGFFYSGSQSVMTTLWEINDKTTTEIINSFYTNLDKGQNKSLALHNAKLDYLSKASLSQISPYYWSSFILVGDTSSIELPRGLPIYYYVIALLLVLAIIVLFRKFRKK